MSDSLSVELPLRDSLFILPHRPPLVKGFLQLFLKFFRRISSGFPPRSLCLFPKRGEVRREGTRYAVFSTAPPFYHFASGMSRVFFHLFEIHAQSRKGGGGYVFLSGRMPRGGGKRLASFALFPFSNVSGTESGDASKTYVSLRGAICKDRDVAIRSPLLLLKLLCICSTVR
jgi:hypothetical protein